MRAGTWSGQAVRALGLILSSLALIVAGLLLAGRLAAYWSPADLINIARTPIAWVAVITGLALGWVNRARVRIALAAGAIVLLGAISLIPLARPAGCAAGRPTVRLLWYNMGGADIRDLDRSVDWIRSQGADVIGLAEAKAGERSAVIARLRPYYPAIRSCLNNGRCSTLLLSRLPVGTSSGLAHGDPENRKALSAATMRLAAHKAPIVAAHLSWPLPLGKQRTELGQLFTAVGADPRLIVMGDFNMTETMHGFQDFLHWTGLRAADASRATWPLRIGERAMVPLLQIDHLLVGDAWGVRAVRAVDGAGSDHRALVADVCPL